MDYDAAMAVDDKNTDNAMKYELPDGKVISVNKARFRCPELLFRPNLNGFEY